MEAELKKKRAVDEAVKSLNDIVQDFHKELQPVHSATMMKILDKYPKVTNGGGSIAFAMYLLETAGMILAATKDVAPESALGVNDFVDNIAWKTFHKSYANFYETLQKEKVRGNQ